MIGRRKEERGKREGESRRVHHAMTRYIPRTRVVGLMCLPYLSFPFSSSFVPLSLILRAWFAVLCLRDGSYYLLTLQMR